MRPIRTREMLPSCVYDGEREAWWWNNQWEAWFIGGPLLMDFQDPDTWIEWTHWLPADKLPEPHDGPEIEEAETLAARMSGEE